MKNYFNALISNYFYEELDWNKIDFSKGDADLIIQEYFEEGNTYGINFKKVKKRWMLKYL